MRVKRGIKASRKKKVLDRASGYRNASSRSYSVAVEKNDKALAYNYRDRKVKKREFRKLWTIRINAAARQCGTTYSRLMGAINKSGVEIDRKILADLAVQDFSGFKAVVDKVMA